MERAVDAMFQEYDRDGSPGAAVLVSDRGRTVLRRCYGLACVEHAVPITPATRFDLASTSKQFTAAAVLLLERDGLLSLDDDIRLYLPELPDLGCPVTIGNLIHHTSGLWDFWQVGQFLGFQRWDYISLEQMLTLLEHQEEFKYKPGTRWEYCNSNYSLLAEIVARLTGEPIDRWAEDHIFRPLGMLDTCFRPDCFELTPRVASPYLSAGDGFRSGRAADVDFAGQSHVFSTLDDMATWLDALRTGKLAGREFVERMYTKGRLANGEEIFYAAGLGVNTYRGVLTVGHSGQTGGYKCDMLYCPEIEVGVVILANLGSADVEGLSRRVLDAYLGERLEPVPEGETEDAPPFIEVDPGIYDRYEGSFQIEGAPIVVCAMRVDDRLLGALSGEGMAFIYPVSETVFFTGHRRVSIEFLPGAAGGFDRLRLDVEGQEMWANRVPDDLEDAQVQEYAGLYYSEALGMAYSVTVEDGGLKLSHRRVGEEETDLIYAGEDFFASGFGFVEFTRGEDGKVSGFAISHEFFGEGHLTFRKVGC